MDTIQTDAPAESSISSTVVLFGGAQAAEIQDALVGPFALLALGTRMSQWHSAVPLPAATLPHCSVVQSTKQVVNLTQGTIIRGLKNRLCLIFFFFSFCLKREAFVLDLFSVHKMPLGVYLLFITCCVYSPALYLKETLKSFESEPISPQFYLLQLNLPPPEACPVQKKFRRSKSPEHQQVRDLLSRESSHPRIRE